jgi:hypothetical protein
VTRPAHQPIDGLAESLGRRADVEGLANGIRRASRRQFLRWALIWAPALIAATLIGAAVDWLAWLPILTLILACLALGGLVAARLRAARGLAAARSRLDGPDGLDGTLAELARAPRKDHAP